MTLSPARISLFTAALAGVLVAVTPDREARACTSILVTKGASTDGSTMVTYAADSHTFYGTLLHRPATRNLPGTTRDVVEWDTGKFLGRIPQAPQTFTVVGQMNERQVAVAETTWGGRDELRDPTGGIDYGSLMFLALERASTAREAIKVMTDLVAEHGYASGGETFSISDPQEAWVMEMVGKGPGQKGAVWVALRVPDGMVMAHANQPRVRRFPRNDPQNVLFSPDVVTVARQKGYFTGKDEEFSFADAYDPLTADTLRACDARVWSVYRRAAPSLKLPIDHVKGVPGAPPLPLWVKPDRKLSVQDVMELMRDHFQGTEFDLSQGVGAGPYGLPYRWRPMTWEVDGTRYYNERSISTQQTGFSLVAQSRSFLPDPVGGLLWFGVDDTYTTVYMPMYAGIRRAPHNLAEGTGSFKQFSWESAFWVFNFVANWSYGRYKDMIVDVRAAQRELEGGFLAQQPETEKAAVKLFQTSPELARDYLTGYSARAAETTVARWRKLGEDLVVKYLDGNVRDEMGQVTHPGYPEAWYRRIALADGAGLKTNKLPGEPDGLSPLPVTGFFHARAELGALAANVPEDFPFGTEKLVLVPGTARCNQPPRCCLAATVGPGGKLVVTPPKAPPDKCGAPAWLVRLPREESRGLFLQRGGH